jgi:serine phosphatase RsbU (regulator of sigma subunit)/ketosteroid isomerase-like protein
MHGVDLAGQTRVDEEEKEEVPVSAEEEKNKALVRHLYEEQAKGNLDVIDEVLATDYVDHDRLAGQEPDREGYKWAIAQYNAAFSGLHLVIEDQLAAGEKVVTRFALSGTHDRGEFMGLAPTGRKWMVTGIAIHRIAGSKIVEEWAEGTSVSDLAEQRLQQERIQRERVEQELHVAHRIQQASLPREIPTLEEWQINPYYQPAREVGGDFYDFFELEDGRLGIVVGDATGKGVPAALVMASARSMLRAVAQASNSPGDVLRRVNDPLTTDIPPNMFVTCFYATLDPKSGSLTYANAGHDLPYLRRRDGGCKELRARGMPLGLMPGMSYEEKEIVLDAGEAALFYSDGLVEAHDPEGEMFGFPRLRALIVEHGEERSLGDILLEELYSFVGEGWEQEDDITLLTLKRYASLS